jgi:predicted MFS family arabinose efflux permease
MSGRDATARAQSDPGSWRGGNHRWGYGGGIFAFVVVMAGGALPTPLYVEYGARFGFGPITVTVIFAAYAVGTLAVLLLFGELSDRAGRRPILLAAIATAALSTAAFLIAHEVGLLIVARFLSGVAVGLVTSTATAALAELHPRGDRARAALVATAANMGGLGIGPVVTGAFAAWAPAPTKLVYWVYLGALVVGVLVSLVIPETAPATDKQVQLRPRRPSIPTELRPELVWLTAAVIAGFATMGVLTALVPTFLRESLQQTSPFTAGGLVTVLFAAVVLVQIAVRGRPPRWSVRAGLVLLPVGLALTSATLATKSLPLLPAALVIAGAGVGATLSGTLTRVQTAADSEQRAAAAAGYFIVAYAAVALPTVGVGLMTSAWGILPAAVTFAAVSAAASLVGLTALHRGPARPRAD